MPDGIDDYQATFDEEPGYLDWAAFGPLLPAVRDELGADATLLGSGRRSSVDLVAERVDEARSLAAELLGARTDEVVLQPSTSHGLMHAIYGLRGGLVLSRAEFPSLTVTATRAAEAFGRIKPQWIEPVDGFVTADAVREALTDDTTAVAVSLVDYRTGYRADLPALREVIGEDRLLIVDATQGFGVVDVDYAAADVVCVHGFKWLRAGRGAAFARFGDRARERLEPVLSGFAGKATTSLDDVGAPAAHAQAFTVSPADPQAAGRLAAGLRAVRDAGVTAIEAEIDVRARGVMHDADRYEIAVLTPREPEERGGIVTLSPRSQDVSRLAASLANHGVTVTTRGTLIRVAVHAGTGADTLRLFGDALATFAATRVD